MRPVGSPIIAVVSPIRKITVMAQVLEVLHLAQQHGVAEMQVRRGGIEAGFHAQRLALLDEALPQVLFADQFRQALLQIDDLFVRWMPLRAILSCRVLAGRNASEAR